MKKKQIPQIPDAEYLVKCENCRGRVFRADYKRSAYVCAKCDEIIESWKD